MKILVMGLPGSGKTTLATALAERLGGQYKVNFSDTRPAAAIFVSRQDHGLLDLLWRKRTGELPMEVPLVISNHSDLGVIAQEFGAHFEHVPVDAATKQEAEARHLALLVEHKIELVVLAKYMQVLTPSFLAAFAPPDAFHQVINIHHSFLPAFTGAKPYHRAWERGVELIGATAHYATVDLDEGPIIEQGVERVDHTLTAEDFVAIGRDIENVVLSRAVQEHVEHRVIANGTKTVVFKR